MSVPAKERTPDASGVSPYSLEEQTVLAKIKTFMNGEPFHYLNTNASLSNAERLKRQTTVATLKQLVTDIRLKKKDENALFDYQDDHFDEADYTWLQELHPGVNVTGWRVFMILMDPVKYGQGLDHPEQQVRGTISQRSAKH